MWVRNYVSMIKEDYLLRVIQSLGRKIAELVEMRTTGKTWEGIALASALFREYAGGDCDDVAFQIDEEVVGGWSAQQTDLMADAAFETALMYWEVGDSERADNFKRIALTLYRDAERKDQSYSYVREEKKEQIDTIIN